MPAPVVAFIPPGRLFAYGDLYPGTPDPVVDRHPVAAPQEVKLYELVDDALDDIRRKGLLFFVGTTLVTRGLC